MNRTYEEAVRFALRSGYIVIEIQRKWYASLRKMSLYNKIIGKKPEAVALIVESR